MPKSGPEYLLEKRSKEIGIFRVTDPEKMSGTIISATLIANIWGSTDTATRRRRVIANLPDLSRWPTSVVILDQEEGNGLEVVHEPSSLQQVFQAAVKLGRESDDINVCIYPDTPPEIVDALKKADAFISSSTPHGTVLKEPDLGSAWATKDNLRTGLYL